LVVTAGARGAAKFGGEGRRKIPSNTVGGQHPQTSSIWSASFKLIFLPPKCRVEISYP
jgi:hypothetical protein